MEWNGMQGRHLAKTPGDLIGRVESLLHRDLTFDCFGSVSQTAQSGSCRDSDAGPTADIYCLAAMLYELLTGQFPFGCDNPAEMLMRIMEGPYTPASVLNPEVPKSVDALLSRMMARKPEHRFQDCTAVISEVTTLALANDRLSFLGS